MILVTGATGLVGSHLIMKLVEDNQKIRTLYRNEKKKKQVYELFQLCFHSRAEEQWEKIEWKKTDILDLVELEDAFIGIDYVYHCAALVSFKKSDFHPMLHVNRRGTANVVNLCIDFGIKKLCHVSSTAVFSTVEHKEPITEKDNWKQGQPTSGYSISKYSSEKEVWRGIEEGLNAVIINPSLIIGAGNWNDSSLTIFRTIENGFKFYTKGANAFVDVRDVVDAMILLMQSEITNERFLCTGTAISFREIFTKIAVKLGKKPPSIFANSFLSGIAWRLAWIKSLFTGELTLTKDSVASAQRVTVYSSSKLQKALNFNFRNIDESIDYAIKNRLK
jgi:nucleoside-diphosphate-sugar epimerase